MGGPLVISIDQDVQIVYNEQDAGNLRTSTHNLVFLEDLSKSKKNSDFVVEILDSNSVGQYISNPNTDNFVSDFFAQNIRPNSFFLVCAAIDSTSGILTTGYLPSEEEFFNSLYIEDAYQGVAYNIDYGNSQTLTCVFPSELLNFYKNKETNNKIYKLQMIGAQNDNDGIIIEIRNDANGNRLVFSTRERGDEGGKINYLEPDSATYPGIILCKSPFHDDFESFKNEVIEDLQNMVNIKITKDSGGTELVSYNIDISNMLSWADLAKAMTEEHSDQVIVLSGEELGCDDDFTLMFRTVEAGATATMYSIVGLGDFPVEILIGDGVDLAMNGGLIVKTGNSPNIAQILSGSASSPGVQIQQGESMERGDKKVMQRFAQVLSSNNVNPNAVVLSRNLNFDLDRSSINVDWTSNYIEGFNSYFGKNISLVLQSSVYQIQDPNDEFLKNPFADWLGDSNGRNIIFNYSTMMNHYLDGVVAAYITGIDFDGNNTLRNFKGLDFSNITPDNDITDEVAMTLDSYQFNYYATMSNGMRMYRQGVTYSTQDVKWIDTNTSLNAIIIDMKDALIRIIKNGKTRMNDGGASKIYSSIANVCDKYVNNGFLSATTKTTNIDGHQRSIVVPPYRIDVSRSFTEENFSSRRFPQVNVYLASSSFVNVIKVNLSNLLLSEV